MIPSLKNGITLLYIVRRVVNCMEHGMESLQDAYLYMVSP
jgi:hypothetical protein